MNCKHAAEGCNYPEGDCPGLCMSGTYLTIVYNIVHPEQPRALLEQADWSAASHTHAIHDRDVLQEEHDRLVSALLATQKALEMAHQAGARYVKANEQMRETILRLVERAEAAEQMLESIGAGGIGGAK